MGPMSMSVPNLKQLSLYSFQSYNVGPNTSKLGHVTQATPTLGSLCDPDAVGVRRVCLCQIYSGYFYSLKSYKGGPKISKFDHVT